VDVEVVMHVLCHELGSDVYMDLRYLCPQACDQDVRRVSSLDSPREQTPAPNAHHLYLRVLGCSPRNVLVEVGFEVVEAMGVFDRKVRAGVERSGDEDLEKASGDEGRVVRATAVGGGDRLCTLAVSMVVEKASHQSCTLAQVVVSAYYLC
jgi:hypothetical protein